jgi:hypothetical protein
MIIIRIGEEKSDFETFIHPESSARLTISHKKKQE